MTRETIKIVARVGLGVELVALMAGAALIIGESIVVLDDVASLQVSVATVATPDERPWFERANGQDGDPSKREPDEARLLRALRREKFAELTAWIEEWEAEFEADPRREQWPWLAVLSFDGRDRSLGPLIDAWVRATPGSWVPYAVRGGYLDGRISANNGWHVDARGKRVLHPPASIWLERARADVETATRLHGRLTLGHRLLMFLAYRERDRDRVQQHYEEAIRLCPACAGPHFTYAATLRASPDDGFAEMRRFADSLHPPYAGLPDPAPFGAKADVYECQALWRRGRYADAKTACDRSLARASSSAGFLASAFVALGAGDDSAALDHLNRFLARVPQSTVRAERATLLARRGSLEAAVHDMTTALQLAPDAASSWQLAELLFRLRAELDRREENGDVAGTRTLLDLAVRLASEHEGLRARRRDHLVEHGVTDEEVAHARKRHEAEFPSFSAARDLDDVLFARDELDEIVKVWDREIAANPKDGRLYYERGGTLHHLGRAEESEGDVRTACRLGFKRACRRLE